MKIIHTSDWHLGHRLYGLNRQEEQKGFLTWLTDQIEQMKVDALIIAGDVFDTHNPSAEATRLYYNFLTNLHRRCPSLQTIVIGGNHDSAARLDAPREVLKSLNVHVIGGLPKPDTEAWDQLYCPIKDQDGTVKAWVVAVPYLRASDLPIQSPNQDQAIINGVREVYALALEGLASRYEQHLPIILTGHCEMQKSLLSLESERALSGYSNQSLPTEVFSDQTLAPAYVALGHLHLAQAVSDTDWIRYSGAPLSFSISEKDYPHQILCATFEQEKLSHIEAIIVPQELKVQMMKIPEKESSFDQDLLPLSFDQVIAEIKKLPNLDEAEPDWKRPLLQVNIHSEHPDPNIKIKVIKELKKKHPRLAKLSITYPKKTQSTQEKLKPKSYLSDIEPEEVFKARWKSKRGVEPPAEQLALFSSLKNQAKQQLEIEQV